MQPPTTTEVAMHLLTGLASRLIICCPAVLEMNDRRRVWCGSTTLIGSRSLISHVRRENRAACSIEARIVSSPTFPLNSQWESFVKNVWAQQMT